MSESLSQLESFLCEEMRIDRRIVTAMTQEIGFESIDDFAHFWTTEEYERGVRQDIVAAVAPFAEDLSKPASRVQIARLRRAWETKRLGRPADPPTVGYGVFSDPLNGLSYDSLFLAVETALMEPWRIVDVDPDSCAVEWNSGGYLDQRLRFDATGEELHARVYVQAEAGEVRLRCRAARGAAEGDELEVVLQLHICPLRVEIFARCADGTRVPWAAPYDEAQDAIEELSRIAQEREHQAIRELGLGLEVTVREGLALDAIWHAIQLLAPNRLGEGLEGELSFVEAAREAVFRFATDGRADEEQVLALRTEPLRCEMFNRHIGEHDRRFYSSMPHPDARRIIDEVMSTAEQLQFNSSSLRRRAPSASSGPG